MVCRGCKFHIDGDVWARVACKWFDKPLLPLNTPSMTFYLQCALPATNSQPYTIGIVAVFQGAESGVVLSFPHYPLKHGASLPNQSHRKLIENIVPRHFHIRMIKKTIITLPFNPSAIIGQ